MGGQQILVIGLGTFGSMVARELADLGHEVMGCDRDPVTVADLAPHLTGALELDATEEDAIRAIAPTQFDAAVVALDRAATILTTMLLEQLGMRNILSRAASELDAEILRRVGAHRVILTDRLMAIWVARTIDLSGALDFIRLSSRTAAVHLQIADRAVGQTIASAVAARPGLHVVALRRGDDVVVDPPADTVFAPGDTALLVGPEDTFRALAG